MHVFKLNNATFSGLFRVCGDYIVVSSVDVRECEGFMHPIVSVECAYICANAHIIIIPSVVSE